MKRQYLGIYKRDGDELKVLFSTPFGPEITAFLDPDGKIEKKLMSLASKPNVALVWDSDGIKIKQL